MLLGSAIALLELGSYLLFLAIDGTAFRYSSMDARRGVLLGVVPEGRARGAGQQMDLVNLVPHPYLGFAFNTESNDEGFERFHGHPVTRFGFVDSNPDPVHRGPGRVVIGILGASVAYWFSAQGDAKLRELLAASPHFAGKEIVFVRMGIGGFKQPQQLMALNYALSVGFEFDWVLNIDGFNEVALPQEECVGQGLYPFFPRAWDRLIGDVPSIEEQRQIGRLFLLREQRADTARLASGGLASRSVTLQLLWVIRDTGFASEIHRAREALAAARRADELPFRVGGPGPDAIPGDRLFDEIAEHWAQCSIQMHSVCRGLGARYLHFLQPNQYDEGSKPMGAAERNVAVWDGSPWPFREGVRAGYPLLSAQSPRLARHGVAFFDLRRVFADVSEPLYVDNCCHLSVRGNELLAEAIAGAILDVKDREALEVRDLRVPEPLTIAAPHTRRQLPVAAVYSDGKVRAAELPRHGTRYESSRPDLLQVTADGRVTARARGEAEIRIVNGTHRRVVPVRMDWGDVVSFGDGRAGTGGITPRLSARGEMAPGQPMTIRVDRARAGANGRLLIGLVQPGDTAHDGLFLGPGPADQTFLTNGAEETRGSGHVEIRVQIPDDPSIAERFAYLQAVVEDPGGRGGFSVSNVLLVTLRR